MEKKVSIPSADFKDFLAQAAGIALAETLGVPPEDVSVTDVGEDIEVDDGGNYILTVKGFTVGGGTPVTEDAPSPEAAPAPARKPRKAKATTPAPAGEVKIYRGGKGRPPAWWAKLSDKQKAHYSAPDSDDNRKLAYMKKFANW